jgi:dolichyl-phosphate-mannose-protein mannosyltransferase
VALLALDGLHFTQSRIGMLNTIMFCFELGSLFFLARFFLDPKRQRPMDMVWSGVLFGLSMNVRWVAFIILPVHALFFIWAWKNKLFKNLSIKKATLFFLTPGIICYLLPFLIFPTLQGFSWKTIWLFHFDMWRYNTTLRAAHDYASEWWTWPMMSRPIWYFFQRQPDQPYPVLGIVCMGNPAILWGIPFLLLYSVWRWIKERRLLWAFVLIGYFSQWLPWAFVSRVKFFHYFHTATPFMCLAMALMLAELWDEDRLGRAVCVLIGLLVVGMFIYWMPLLNATPITEEYFRHHLWFPNGWV